mmetsp:Transcript_95328/g.266950  ORF Transcript_95328/g.266950 Transcript_95328/m.266950 type:complete len:145 (-) Transcript_95328:171-605(-)
MEYAVGPHLRNATAGSCPGCDDLLLADLVFAILVIGVCLIMTIRECFDDPIPQWSAHVAAVVEQNFPTRSLLGEPMCVICMSAIDPAEPCRLTQCGHAFHAGCIVRWWVTGLRRPLTCPICRQIQHCPQLPGDPAGVCCAMPLP